MALSFFLHVRTRLLRGVGNSKVLIYTPYSNTVADGSKSSYCRLDCCRCARGKRFATKEGLSGMRRAARFAAEDTVITRNLVESMEGSKGGRGMACRRKIICVQIGCSPLDKRYGTVYFYFRHG